MDSPLKKLVALHQNSLVPARVVPKKRIKAASLQKKQVKVAETAPNQVNYYSFVSMNMNINFDKQSMGTALKHSAKLAKGIAVGAAAMIGTAFLFKDPESKVSKVKIPPLSKVVIPKRI